MAFYSSGGSFLSSIDRKINVRTYMLAALLILAAVYALSPGTSASQMVVQLALGVGTAIVIEEVWNFVLYRILLWPPTSSAISGLLVAGLFPLGSHPLIVCGAAAIAIASKHVLRWDGAHLFNPANAGVLFVGLLAGVPAVWWIGDGITVTSIPVLAVLLGLFLVWKVRREEVALSYLVIYGLLLGGWALLRHAPLLLSLSIINFYFVFFMLIEPITSPFKRKQKIAYGAIAGLVGFAALFLLPEFSDNIALLVANASVLVLPRIIKE